MRSQDEESGWGGGGKWSGTVVKLCVSVCWGKRESVCVHETERERVCMCV